MIWRVQRVRNLLSLQKKMLKCCGLCCQSGLILSAYLITIVVLFIWTEIMHTLPSFFDFSCSLGCLLVHLRASLLLFDFPTLTLFGLPPFFVLPPFTLPFIPLSHLVCFLPYLVHSPYSFACLVSCSPQLTSVWLPLSSSCSAAVPKTPESGVCMCAEMRNDRARTWIEVDTVAIVGW